MASAITAPATVVDTGPVVASAILPAPAAATRATASCRAALALKQSSHPALRRLRVQETEQAIIITGRVSTYYLKQLAQETIMSVRGELTLVNEVLVERGERGS